MTSRKNHVFPLPRNLSRNLKLLENIFCSISLELSDLMKKSNENQLELIKTLNPRKEVERAYRPNDGSIHVPLRLRVLYTYLLVCLYSPVHTYMCMHD